MDGYRSRVTAGSTGLLMTSPPHEATRWAARGGRPFKRTRCNLAGGSTLACLILAGTRRRKTVRFRSAPERDSHRLSGCGRGLAPWRLPAWGDPSDRPNQSQPPQAFSEWPRRRHAEMSTKKRNGCPNDRHRRLRKRNPDSGKAPFRHYHESISNFPNAQ